MPSGMVKSLLTRASGLLAARLAGAALALFANILIARGFGAEALGIFALILALASLLSVFLPLGFQAIGVMVVSQYRAKSAYGQARQFLVQGCRNIVWSTLVAALLVIAGFYGWTVATDTQPPLALAFVLLIAPPLAAMNLNASYLNGRKMAFAAWLPDLVTKPLLMTAGIFLAIQLFTTPGQFHLLGAVAASYWLTLGFQTVSLRRANAGISREVSNDQGQWYATATPWIFITILSEYFVELNLLLAGLLLLPAQVAILHVCFRLRMLTAFGLRALYGLALPDIYSCHANNDWTGFRQHLLLANGLAVTYAVAVSGGLYLLGEYVLWLFGEAFVAGTSALVVVSLAMVIRAAFGPAPAVLAAHGYHMGSFVILLIGSVLTAILAVSLVGQFGLLALASAYTISYSAVAIAQWWWLKHRTGIDSSIFAGILEHLKNNPQLDDAKAT